MSNLGTQYPIKKYLVIATVLIALLSIIGTSMSVSAQEIPAQSNPFLYSFNNDGTVAIIDLKNDNIIGQNRNFGMGIFSQWSNHYWDGWTFWSRETGTNDYIAVDVKTQRVTQRINSPNAGILSTRPYDGGTDYIQITPDLKRVYVAHSASDQIIELDPETGTQTAVYTIPYIFGDPTTAYADGSNWPCDNAISPDGKYMCTPGRYDDSFLPDPKPGPFDAAVGSISIIDIDPTSPTYFTEIVRVPTSGRPVMTTYSPDGRYCFAETTNQIGEWVFDMTTMSLVPGPSGGVTIPTVRGFCSEFTKDGKFAWITGGQRLDIVRMSDLKHIMTVDVGSSVGCVMTWSPDGKYAYYPDRRNNRIAKIEVANPNNIKLIPVPGGPSTLVVAPPMRHDDVQYGPLSNFSAR